MIKYFRAKEKSPTQQIEAFEKGCWIDLVNPTDDEVEDVSALTGIPDEMLKAALDEEETARFERDEGNMLVLLDTPIITDSDDGDLYETIPLALITNEKCIVTVSLRGNPVLGDFIASRIDIDTGDNTTFLLRFLMGNAKRFLFNLRQIDKKSLRVQAELHRSMKNKELIQLLALENSLVYFSTSLSANLGVYNKLERLPSVANVEDNKDLYDDIVIETRQAVEMCNIYRDILSGTMDAYASVISNNLNIVMKLLTVITMIISVPTLIASLWGMNVEVPLQNVGWWGFWVVIGVCVLITGVVSFFLIRASSSVHIGKARQTQNRRKHRRD